MESSLAGLRHSVAGKLLLEFFIYPFFLEGCETVKLFARPKMTQLLKCLNKLELQGEIFGRNSNVWHSQARYLSCYQ